MVVVVVAALRSDVYEYIGQHDRGTASKGSTRDVCAWLLPSGRFACIVALHPYMLHVGSTYCTVSIVRFPINGTVYLLRDCRRISDAQVSSLLMMSEVR